MTDFLPGLLARSSVTGLTGVLRIRTTDGEDWAVNLDEPGTRPRSNSGTTVTGTRSEMLLWLTNRVPIESVDVTGSAAVADAWTQLRH